MKYEKAAHLRVDEWYNTSLGNDNIAEEFT
jgi:hypothetical protein